MKDIIVTETGLLVSRESITLLIRKDFINFDSFLQKCKEYGYRAVDFKKFNESINKKDPIFNEKWNSYHCAGIYNDNEGCKYQHELFYQTIYDLLN